jgi:hypothetical protein
MLLANIISDRILHIASETAHRERMSVSGPRPCYDFILFIILQLLPVYCIYADHSGRTV